MNSSNQTRQYLHIILLIHRLTWWNKFAENDSLTVEECDQHHSVFLPLKMNFLRLRELVERYFVIRIFVFGSYWK
jgi:hypothetical protein